MDITKRLNIYYNLLTLQNVMKIHNETRNGYMPRYIHNNFICISAMCDVYEMKLETYDGIGQRIYNTQILAEKSAQKIIDETTHSLVYKSEGTMNHTLSKKICSLIDNVKNYINPYVNQDLFF